MKIALKALFQRPLSKADLLSAAEHHLSNPPFPDSLRDSLAQIVASRAGQSLLDYWRGRYTKALEDIASASTYRLQRSALLRTILSEEKWVNLYSAVEKAQYEGSWLPILKEVFSGVEEASPKAYRDLLFQGWLVAIGVIACLTELGGRYYDINETKTLELEALSEFRSEVRRLQIALNDMLFEVLEERPELVQEASSIQQERITPLLNDQWALIRLMEEQVVNGKLDAVKIEQRLQEISSKKKELALLLFGPIDEPGRPT